MSKIRRMLNKCAPGYQSGYDISVVERVKGRMIEGEVLVAVS